MPIIGWKYPDLCSLRELFRKPLLLLLLVVGLKCCQDFDKLRLHNSTAEFCILISLLGFAVSQLCLEDLFVLIETAQGIIFLISQYTIIILLHHANTVCYLGDPEYMVTYFVAP